VAYVVLLRIIPNMLHLALVGKKKGIVPIPTLVG